MSEQRERRIGEEELREIEERANAATPGPWAWIREYCDHPLEVEALVGPDVDTEVIGYFQCGSHHMAIEDRDAAFIEHARSDIPRLVAEVRRLRGLLVQWERSYEGTGTPPDQTGEFDEEWRAQP